MKSQIELLIKLGLTEQQAIKFIESTLNDFVDSYMLIPKVTVINYINDNKTLK